MTDGTRQVATYLERSISNPPITVPVTDTAVRVPVLRPPYSVINLSDHPEHTIWLADHPGVVPHYGGTPVYSGTSLQWNRPGDLWAICGQDHTSLDPCLLQVSYDVTDWAPNPITIATAILNSGVVIVDNPLTVFDGQLLSGGATPIFDTSRYSSVYVYLMPTQTITYPNVCGATINFCLDGDPAKSMRMLTPGFGELGAPWSVNLPIVGNSLQVGVGPPGRSNFDCRVVLSHRSIGMIQNVVFAEAFQLGTQHLLVYGPISQASGAAGFSIDSLPPFYGQVNFTIIATGGAPPVNVDTRISVQEVVSGINRTLWAENSWNTIAASMAQIFGTIYLTGNAVRVTMVNMEGSNRFFTLWVTPAFSNSASF